MAQTIQPAADLNDRAFLQRVNDLRKTDNWKNWFFLLREYAFLILVIGGTVTWCEFLWFGDGPLILALPALFVCNLCVGAGQHRLATFTHEAAHYMLFKNRLLNELASEWFCMFPVLGTTHSYRVQHLGHHQYPNDPERDPDWVQMTLSGHRYDFPMSRGGFIWECLVKQIVWFPKLIRYVLVRAFFKADGPAGSPYRMKRRASPVLTIFSIAYLLSLIGAMSYLVWMELPLGLAGTQAAFFVAGIAFFQLAPNRWFSEFSIKSDLPMRAQNTIRLVYYTLLFGALAWITLKTGRPAWLYFFLLWLTPLGTSFAFFMILRQIVQHGNADRNRLTNTRVFHVHPLIRLSVFPVGNDYHLPHHLFPLVPHYNLPRLHALLMETESYRDHAIVVEGYFLPSHRPQTQPTVLDLMTKNSSA